jgi:hypothetical protein
MTADYFPKSRTIGTWLIEHILSISVIRRYLSSMRIDDLHPRMHTNRIFPRCLEALKFSEVAAELTCQYLFIAGAYLVLSAAS